MPRPPCSDPEQELADFFDNAAIALHWVGPDGIILRANRAECALLGYPAEDYVGHHIAEFHADADVIEGILRRLHAGEELHRQPARLRHRDGSLRHVLIDSNVLWRDGRFVHTRCITHDVTALKQAEDERAALLAREREARAEAEALNRVARQLCSELDVHKLLQAVTDAGTELTGARYGAFAPTFEGRGIVRSDDITRDPRYGRAAPRHGMPAGYVAVRSYLAVPVLARSGTVLGGLFFGHPQAGVFGERAERVITGVAAQAAVALDNARLFAEREQGERGLQQLIDALPAAIYTTDATGHLTHFNPAAAAFSGRTPQLGTDQWCVSWRLYHADGTPLPHDQCPMAVALKQGRPVPGGEFIAERPDGTRRWFTPYATPLIGADGRVAGGINMLVDITERKQADLKMRESEERFRTLVQAITSVIWVTDAEGRFVAPQPSWAAYTGQDFDVSRDYGWAEALHPDDRQRVLEAWRAARAARTLYRAEGRLWHAASRSYRHFEARGAPIANPDGSVREWIGKYLDVEDRKRAEAALREADRRKDEFLATLSHELRNPLAPMRNAVQMLHLKPPPTPELRWARDIIDRQVQQMTRLVDDLLDVSRISSNRLDLEREPVDLASVLQGAVETSRPLIEECGHELVLALPDEPIALHADLTRLAQVVSNLLNNAAKYTPRGGCITLAAEQRDGEVRVSVKDNGIGIEAADLPGVFDMFSQLQGSLSRSRGGLGIGLALVRRLVEMHGGRVEAHSAGAGRGSEFIVRLPALSAPPPEVAPPEAAASPARELRILVVDDNRDAAASSAMLMELMGNEVRLAHDGEAAVSAAREFRPHVVLLDIGLPKMSGHEAARCIRQQPWGKEMILVAVTGWGQDEDRRRSDAAGFDHHLTKPMDPAALARLLQRRDAVPARR